MAVLPLKCYLNDKVVWLRGLRGVILYTFTRLHRETGDPAFGLHRPRVATSRPSVPLARPLAPVCAHVLYVTITYPRARVWTPVYIGRVFRRVHTSSCDIYRVYGALLILFHIILREKNSRLDFIRAIEKSKRSP